MSRKKTHDEYLQEVFDLNPLINVIGLYDGNKKKILHQCKICNHCWTSTPLHIIQGHGCPECAKKNRADKKRMSEEEYKNRVLQNNPNIQINGKFLGVHSEIEVECKICHSTWKPKAYDLLHPHAYSGCKNCYSISQTKTSEDFLRELFCKFPHIHLLGNYVNSYTKTLFQCTKCEKNCVWESAPRSILSGCKSPECNLSNGALIILNFLNAHNISFVSEKTFMDCQDKKMLPFDFYLPDYNLCIEYDGEQHYKPICFHGCDMKKAWSSFLSTYTHDLIKNQYCFLNKINLLRIPYYDFDNIEDILNQNILFYRRHLND